MQDKTIGYILLTVGILIMIFGMAQIALLVTRVVTPYPTFQFTQIFKLGEDANAQLETLIPSSLSGIDSVTQKNALAALDPTVANELLNFAVYFFFMSFVAGIGYKVADLGVKLIRPAVLKMSPHDIQNSMPGNIVNP